MSTLFPPGARASPLALTAWEFRRDEAAAGHPLPSGGLVVLFRGRAVGWMDSLRWPDRYQPGAVAIDPDGRAWKATGGDAWNGATTWEPLYGGKVPS